MNRIGLAAFMLLAIFSQVLSAGGITDVLPLPSGYLGHVRQNAHADWLVKDNYANRRPGRSPLPLGTAESGTPLAFMAYSGETLPYGPAGSEVVPMAGGREYALEFLGASVGSSASLACACLAASHDWDVPDDGLPVIQLLYGTATYAVTSALLPAAGTHLTGRFLGQRRSFGHAVIGGAIGGLAGGAALFDAVMNRHVALLPVGLILPPLCAVIGYNM